jgi:hypothetical protein
MKIKPLLCLALVFGGSAFGEPFPDPPQSPGPDLPGGDKYKIETYWLAPYVRVSKGLGGTTVAWLGDDGQIKRQVAATLIEPGFLDVIDHGETIQGVNEDWRIKLPSEHIDPNSRHSMSGYITSTPDSRVFVHEYHPRGGWVAEDIYVHGKLANTAGPFVQHLADEIQLNDDGSASLVICKDESRSNVQLVTLDTNGDIRARVDGDPGPVGPGGELLHPAANPDLGSNARALGWIPGSHRCLFSSSLGFEDHYHLVDEDTGKEIWNIASPGGGYWLAIGLTPKFIIFSQMELYRGGSWRGDERVLLNNGKEWIRAFYAVSVEDGQIFARWQAQYPQRLGDADHDHFLLLGNELYYITTDEFTGINLDDINAKRNGWK